MNPPTSFHLVLAITGASGACYAARLLEKLCNLPNIHTSIILSEQARGIWQYECKTPLPQAPHRHYWELYDFSAPFASGSNCADAMLILPCSMCTIARIAQGISDTLIARTADVQLKERRPLVIVPRESPYNLIHLQNLLLLTQAGAIIAPASPSFYHLPATIEELINPFIDRLLFLCGATPVYDGFKWGGDSVTTPPSHPLY
jgi:4-hydroxy-3-polyprenylbenzoate decarboxylase